MNDVLILCDTRNKKDEYITNYFDKNNITWLRSTLPSADFMVVRYNNGFIKDFCTLVDTKKDVEEIAGNLCNTVEHQRIKREIEKARELGCENFIFLICDNKIKSINDLINWSSKRTMVQGKTLYKIMVTMRQKYGVRFIFVSKKDAGRKILELLN